MVADAKHSNHRNVPGEHNSDNIHCSYLESAQPVMMFFWREKNFAMWVVGPKVNIDLQMSIFSLLGPKLGMKPFP